LWQTLGVSPRRGRGAIGVDRSSVRYRSRRPDDRPVRARLRALAAVRRRFGHRRLYILPYREGLSMNHKEAPAALCSGASRGRRRRDRKRALGTRAPLAIPQGPNSAGLMNFPSDSLSDGRPFRILAIVDDFMRECLCLVAGPAPRPQLLELFLTENCSTPDRHRGAKVPCADENLNTEPRRAESVFSARVSRCG
jgi:putative transposase